MGSKRARAESTGVKIALVMLVVGVAAVGTLWLWLRRTPLLVIGPEGPAGQVFDANTPEGRLFRSVLQCAYNQKDLYLYIDAYVQKYGHVPPDLDALREDHPMTMAIFGCPSGGSYEIHLEHFGDPNAVVIADGPEAAHPNALRLWIQGIRPQVRTMGDGTIHLFNKPSIATVHAKKGP